jgi:hypothetical protein
LFIMQGIVENDGLGVYAKYGLRIVENDGLAF